MCDQTLQEKLCILVSGMLIAAFLGACSSSQRTSDSSTGDDVVWLDSPPQCAFTELASISGQVENSNTFRDDQLSSVKHTMVEEAQVRGGDAVIKASVTPIGGKGGNSVFEYRGRVIQFEEPACYQ